MLILIWNVTSTAATNLALAEAAFGCDSAFQPSGHPLRPRPAPRLPVFSTTGAAVMPAANARERLTQAPPYGRDGASIAFAAPPCHPRHHRHHPCTLPSLFFPLRSLLYLALSPRICFLLPRVLTVPHRRLEGSRKEPATPLQFLATPPTNPSRGGSRSAKRFTFREHPPDKNIGFDNGGERISGKR